MQLTLKREQELAQKEYKPMTQDELMDYRELARKKDKAYYQSLAPHSSSTWDVYENFLRNLGGVQGVTNFITSVMRELHQEHYYEPNLTRGSAPLLFTHSNAKFIPSLPDLVADLLDRYQTLDKKLLLDVARSNKKTATAEVIEWSIRKEKKLTIIDDKEPGNTTCVNPFAFLNSRQPAGVQTSQTAGEQQAPKPEEGSSCLVM